MRLSEIVEQYKGKITRSRWLVVKSPCEETGEPIFSVIYEAKNLGNICQHMQETHIPIVYPIPDNYEVVDLELHHPQNDLFHKYGILPKAAFNSPSDWGWGRTTK